MITSNEIGEICIKLRNISKLQSITKVGNEAADLIDRMAEELKTCNNELCLYCGSYKQAHNGACNGCRWQIHRREVPERARRETR